MSVHEREVDGVLILHPALARITRSSGVSEFGASLRRARETGHLAIAIDLQGVEYADSELITALLTEFKQLIKMHGLMCLFNVGTELREFFRQTIIDHLIEIHEDKRSAVDRFADLPKRTRTLGRLTTALVPVYTWLHKVGVTADCRRLGDRRVVPDRRCIPDRRSYRSQARAVPPTAAPSEPPPLADSAGVPADMTLKTPTEPAATRRRAGGRRPYGTTKEETEILNAMIRMRGDDLSFQRIADELNKAGYRNQSGNLWAKGNVYTILKRYTGDTNVV